MDSVNLEETSGEIRTTTAVASLDSELIINGDLNNNNGSTKIDDDLDTNQMNVEINEIIGNVEFNDIQIENLIVDINEVNTGSIDELLDNLSENNDNEKLIEISEDTVKPIIQENLVEIDENHKLVDIVNPENNGDDLTLKENDKLIEIETEHVTKVEDVKTEEITQAVPHNRELDELNSKLNEFNDDQKALGIIAPNWIPDSEVSDCMKCNAKFTFTKRRHHCRGCGFLFCATCCHLRIILQYSPKYQSRVCNLCFQVIEKSNFLKKNSFV